MIPAQRATIVWDRLIGLDRVNLIGSGNATLGQSMYRLLYQRESHFQAILLNIAKCQLITFSVYTCGSNARDYFVKQPVCVSFLFQSSNIIEIVKPDILSAYAHAVGYAVPLEQEAYTIRPLRTTLTFIRGIIKTSGWQFLSDDRTILGCTNSILRVKEFFHVWDKGMCTPLD